VSAAAAAVLSFTAWRDLALYTGGDPDTAWVLPVAVDVLAAGALTAYVLWHDAVAHLVAVLVCAVSSAGNALSHLYAVQVSGARPVAPTWVVVGVGALPPLVLYVNAHLYARKTREDPDDPRARPGAGPARRRARTGGHDPGAGLVADSGRAGPVRDGAGPGGPVGGRPGRGPDPGTVPESGNGDRAGTSPPAGARPPGTDALARRLVDEDLTQLGRREVAARFRVGNVKAGDALRLARARGGGA